MMRIPRRRRVTPVPTEPETEPDASQEIEYVEEGEPLPTEQPEEPIETSEPGTYAEELTQPQEETMALEPVSGEEFDTYLDALDRLSMEQLILVINTAQHLRSGKENEVRQKLLEEFRERAREVGMSLESVIPTMHVSGRKKSEEDGGSSVKMNYRGPNGELASGRGVPPRWMQTIIADGEYKKEDFYIHPDGMTKWERDHQRAA